MGGLRLESKARAEVRATDRMKKAPTPNTSAIWITTCFHRGRFSLASHARFNAVAMPESSPP